MLGVLFNENGFVKSLPKYVNDGVHVYLHFTFGVKFDDDIVDYFVKVWGHGATVAKDALDRGDIKKGSWISVEGFVKEHDGWREVHCNHLVWDKNYEKRGNDK